MDKWRNLRNLKLSDPNNYDRNNYMFLVHAIDLPNSSEKNYQLMRVLNEFGGEFSSSQMINLNLNPERIAEKKLISCSLVAKKGKFEALETYKSFGLIVKCPIENIVFAGSQDLGILYSQFDNVMKKYQNVILPSVECLLNPEEYDEILINGTTVYGKVEIVGVFINLRNASMEDERFAKLVYEAAGKLSSYLGVPLTYFPKRKYTIEDKPVEIIYDSWPGELPFLQEISFNKNGRKYRLFIPREGEPLLQATSGGIMKLMDKNDYTIFMSEIYKLPKAELLKVSNLIQQLPYIFEKQQSNNESDCLNRHF